MGCYVNVLCDMRVLCWIMFVLVGVRSDGGGVSSPAPEEESGGGGVPAVFVLGDSLVDVGNNNHLKLSLAKADFPHNGIDFPSHKPTGRFTNGKNAADFLSEKVGLPTSPPYLALLSKNSSAAAFLAGVSFASGGAGIFDDTDKKYRQSIPLTSQVDDYERVYGEIVKELGSDAAKARLSKSIFFVVIGSNDIFAYFKSGRSGSRLRSSSTPQRYVDLMASTLKAQLKRMHGLGGRKFVVAGIGMIGCCPSQRLKNETGGCHEAENYLSLQYNQLLTSSLQQLKSELPDMKYTFFDTYAVLNNISQKPAAYGFNEVKAACCGLGDLKARVPCLPIASYCSDRRSHLFWDFFHPTEATARIFVENIFDGPQQYASPVNVRQLVAL
ncbi:GDSL esterase/lipase At5g55050 [Malania oleifera]|uniref:GDSL esterase/lipase At5g55050 n=1 Tax=Malania oleifera TaxID=397392 RepID=UPI0025AE4039|nr:GDSL esterase/lipase At5g55050 [Malania oleifera]